MTEKTENRLAKLKQRKAQLDAQIAAAEAKAKNAARKLDTRRKIILGGAILAAMEESEGLRYQVQAVLEQHVTRPNDREAVADLLQRSATVKPPSGG